MLNDILISHKLTIDNNVVGFILNFPNFIIAPIFYLSVDYYIHPAKKWKSKNFLLFGFGFFMIAFFTIVEGFLKKPGETDQQFF